MLKHELRASNPVVAQDGKPCRTRTRFAHGRVPAPSADAPKSRCEQILQNREGRRANFSIEAAEPFNQTGLIHGAYLVENDLAGPSLESAGYTRRIRLPPRCHWCDDHRT